MPFVILDPSGDPLRDISGNVIVFDDPADAKPFLMPGERFAPSDWDDGELPE